MTFNLENLRVTQGQKDLAAYIKAETGKVVKPEQISLIDALRVEFRKDPKRVKDREAMREAARKRKADAMERYLAKARSLAAELGHPVEDAAVVEQEHGTEVVAVAFDPEPESPVAFEDEDANVTPITAAPSRRTVDNDFGGDTSAIEVVESSDGFETSEPVGSDYDEDF